MKKIVVPAFFEHDQEILANIVRVVDTIKSAMYKQAHNTAQINGGKRERGRYIQLQISYFAR